MVGAKVGLDPGTGNVSTCKLTTISECVGRPRTTTAQTEYIVRSEGRPSMTRHDLRKCSEKGKQMGGDDMDAPVAVQASSRRAMTSRRLGPTLRSPHSATNSAKLALSCPLLLQSYVAAGPPIRHDLFKVADPAANRGSYTIVDNGELSDSTYASILNGPSKFGQTELAAFQCRLLLYPGRCVRQLRPAGLA
jgi:hypothetical protein